MEEQGVNSTHLEEAQVGTRVRVQLDYRDPQQQGPNRHAFAAGASGAELAPTHELPRRVLLGNPPRGGARNKANSGIDVTPRPVLLELLSLLEVLVFIPERFSHLFRCSGNH